MARNQKILNTACKAIFKDGRTEEFNSIEEASESTGISVASIKIRCNKPGCGGKDKTRFEWLDEHTKKSYQAKKSKNKGKNLELQIVNDLKAIGYEGCATSRSCNRKADADKIDIVDELGELPTNIQAKCYTNTPSYFNLRDACSDKDTPFTEVWKKSPSGEGNSLGTIAMIDYNFFLELLKFYRIKNS